MHQALMHSIDQISLSVPTLSNYPINYPILPANAIKSSSAVAVALLKVAVSPFSFNFFSKLHKIEYQSTWTKTTLLLLPSHHHRHYHHLNNSSTTCFISYRRAPEWEGYGLAGVTELRQLQMSMTVSNEIRKCYI